MDSSNKYSHEPGLSLYKEYKGKTFLLTYLLIIIEFIKWNKRGINLTSATYVLGKHISNVCKV